MKRFGNLFSQVIDKENIIKAAMYVAHIHCIGEIPYDDGAKSFFYNLDFNVKNFQEKLIAHTYRLGKYSSFNVFEYGKKRTIEYFKTFTDNVLQQAVIQIVEPIWNKIYILNTYSSIKKRGTQKCADDVQRALKNHKEETKFCLKYDVHHFYDSINHSKLKSLVRRKIKDKDLLWILDSYIDSKSGDSGIAIGVNLSRFFANLHLAYLDHFIKEKLKAKFYFRYADDGVVLGSTKEELFKIREEILSKFTDLVLEMKSNWQVFPTDSRGVDFVGYKMFHTHTLMRKKIKKNFCKRVFILNKLPNLSPKEYVQGICGWLGWAKHSNSKNLLKKIIKPKFYDYVRQKAQCMGIKRERKPYLQMGY